MATKQLTPAQFKKRLDTLQKHALFTAFSYYAVWEELTPATDAAARHVDRFRGFFATALQALHDMMIIEMAKIFDGHPRAFSLPNLLDAAEQFPALLPHAGPNDVQKMRALLGKHEDKVLKAVQQFRNYRLAHIQAEPAKKMPIIKGEWDSLIEDVKGVFNQLATAHSRSWYEWSFLERQAVRHTAGVVELVREDAETRKAESEELVRRAQAAQRGDTIDQ